MANEDVQSVTDAAWAKYNAQQAAAYNSPQAQAGVAVGLLAYGFYKHNVYFQIVGGAWLAYELVKGTV